METIYKTVVGSKMHGLDTPNSDLDTRTIYKLSHRELVSPFPKDSTLVSNNTEDSESWEIRKFVKHLTSGNPTMYEVIYSPLYEENEYSGYIQALKKYTFNSQNILNAHIGYANAQLKRYLNDPPEKMEDNYLKRVPKSIVAAYRVLYQAEQLLISESFEPVIKDFSPHLHERLMEIKLIDPKFINHTFIRHHKREIEDTITYIKEIHNHKYPTVLNKIDYRSLEDILLVIHKL